MSGSLPDSQPHSTLDCEHYNAPTATWRLCPEHERELERAFSPGNDTERSRGR
jgi:hypothetical protein